MDDSDATRTTDDPWPENRARLEATFEGAAMLDKPITERPHAEALHRAVGDAVQRACGAIPDLTRSLDPRRTVGPLRNDLRAAKAALLGAVEDIDDALGLLS